MANDNADKWRSISQQHLHRQRVIGVYDYQYDALVALFTEKFARPAAEIMNLVELEQLLESPAALSNAIEWEYRESWHHEGRRARMGAAMMAPDYAWWHGIYDVAHSFSFKLIPEARHDNNEKVNAYIDHLLKKDPMHVWLGSNTGEIKKATKSGDFQEIYQHMCTG